MSLNHRDMTGNKARINLCYNIHDLITFQINCANSIEFIKDINQPLSFFKVDRIRKPDIILNIGKFTPDKRSCDVINNKIYIKKNYIYCSEIIDKTKIHCEIANLESIPTIINFCVDTKKMTHRLFPLLMAQNLVLRPLIDFKLLQKDIISIHAAGVANGNKAIIMAGRGGAFKTTLTMELIRKSGFQFIGEDRLLLGKENLVFAFPIYQKLFAYRLNKMKTEKFDLVSKLKFIFFDININSNKEYIKNVSHLWKFFSIVKHTKENIDYKTVSKNDLITKIRLSQQIENISVPGILKMSSGIMYEYFAAYSFKFPFSEIASYWQNYEKILCKRLAAPNYLEIYIPSEYSRKTYDAVLELIRQ